MTLATLFAGLWGERIEPREIRAEVWALGTRHCGRPLEGAQAELRAGGLPARRAAVLRAVVRSLTGPAVAEAPR
jgi:hypothetical protein